MEDLSDPDAAVQHELVARQLDEQIAGRFSVGQRLRVLDVGLGPGAPEPATRGGSQALRLARAGHRITVLESDPRTLGMLRAALVTEPEGIRERVRFIEGAGRDTGVHFLPGSFDVVLCHGVLMYIAEPDAMLAGLARVLAPGGLLSLLVRNADALAMRPGIAGDWAGALSAFDSPVSTGLGGLKLRADRLGALTATLAGIGAPLHAWYGIRVFTGAAGDGERPPHVFAGPVGDGERPPHAPPAAGLQARLAAEERAGRTDPYRAVAALLHLCGVRG
ncbi:methyltransferase domain-containing protein [Streptomyces sp. NPDC051776]|uniref:methyltransferase domain-containing protein n=1 Tax=Streptomyces sp. NPDC051776 TaxID=3155414 RepID=UPI00342B96F9